MTLQSSAGDRRALLALARAAVTAAVGGHAPPVDDRTGVFNRRAGAFVTIHAAGVLRGCVGRIDPDRLGDVVVHCAGAAAIEDPRFTPVSADEVPAIHIELSLLGPLTPLPDPAALQPGRHGLVVASGGRRGLLLPQVAVEWGWTREEFLRQTCLKAGLPADAWQRGAQLLTFDAEIFAEPRG